MKWSCQSWEVAYPQATLDYLTVSDKLSDQDASYNVRVETQHEVPGVITAHLKQRERANVTSA